MIQVALENGWVVKPYNGGLDVYEDDELICELEGSELWEFKDEWGNIDESELEAAIREEIELNNTMAKLAEMQ